MIAMRRTEVLIDGTWRERAFEALCVGDRFRLWGADGTQIAGEWIAESTASPCQPDGNFIVSCRPATAVRS